MLTVVRSHTIVANKMVRAPYWLTCPDPRIYLGTALSSHPSTHCHPATDCHSHSPRSCIHPLSPHSLTHLLTHLISLCLSWPWLTLSLAHPHTHSPTQLPTHPFTLSFSVSSQNDEANGCCRQPLAFNNVKPEAKGKNTKPLLYILGLGLWTPYILGLGLWTPEHESGMFHSLGNSGLRHTKAEHLRNLEGKKNHIHKYMRMFLGFRRNRILFLDSRNELRAFVSPAVLLTWTQIWQPLTEWTVYHWGLRSRYFYKFLHKKINT
jgi:hypothetical protein